MADEMNGEREALQRALGVIERWARDAYVVCGKPATQDGFEAAWKAEDADAYEVWSAARASLAANAGGEPVAWAWFAENGNIRVWTTAPREVQRLAAEEGLHLSPLYTHPSPPEGMVMVPKVPTNAMTSAGANAVEDPENERSSWDLAENMWRAMIAAAPPLPASEAKDTQ